MRCGFVGQNMSKHIREQHPLHPVKYYCSVCDFTHGRKSEVTMHVSKEHEFGKATVKAHVMSPCVYRWDVKEKIFEHAHQVLHHMIASLNHTLRGGLDRMRGIVMTPHRMMILMC